VPSSRKSAIPVFATVQKKVGVDEGKAMTQIPASRVSIRKVLAATDFSPLSEKALRQAMSIARRYHAKFYIVHVVSSWGFNVAGYNAAVEASKLAEAAPVY
jgi:K+-sensing histidine kinase KdpD